MMACGILDIMGSDAAKLRTVAFLINLPRTFEVYFSARKIGKNAVARNAKMFFFKKMRNGKLPATYSQQIFTRERLSNAGTKIKIRNGLLIQLYSLLQPHGIERYYIPICSNSSFDHSSDLKGSLKPRFTVVTVVTFRNATDGIHIDN